MQNKKSTISLLTSMLLVMQLCINPIITYADVSNDTIVTNNEVIEGNDTRVENVRFNKSEVNVGDTLELTATIENLHQGSRVYAQLWFPQNNLEHELKYNEELKLYTTEIKIEESFRYKTLNLLAIEIRNENESSLQYHPKLSVIVADENGITDKVAPVINSINVNKTEIKVGETLEVSVNATDDVSGIAQVMGSVFINGKYNELKFSYDEAKNLYMGYYEITEDLINKTIGITNIAVIDKSDKSTYSSDLINISVVDGNGNKDDVKPVINSIEFDKEYYKVGDTIKLYVDTYDNESGIQFVEAYVKIGIYTKSLLLEYNEELKKYTNEIYITEDMEGSKIILANLRVADNAYNYADFEKEVSAYVLTNDGRVDMEAPIMSNIEYDKVKLDLQDKLQITLNATDNISGIDEIKAKINSGDKSFTYSFSKYDGSDNKYVLVIKTEEYMYFKNLNIEYIEAIDYAGNKNKIDVNKSIPVTNEARIINENTDVNKIIEEIKSSEEDKITLFLNNNDKIVHKEIFNAIAGTDKIITFLLKDGTTWTFKGKDIINENIASIKLSVSNKPTEEAKAAIERLTNDAIFIKFDYHGHLPGKALVKLKVNNEEFIGKKLTLYYYNPDTKEVEKIDDNIFVDKDGYAILEIDHCSDYFLSANSNLLGTEEPGNNEGETPDNSGGQASEDINQEGNNNENGYNNLPETGGDNPIFTLIVGFSLLGVGGILTVRRK
ncbi:MAG: LPXTG cell wall anchor domain-containing protein [Clostridium sp.]|uniref:LPXTG cell wall anchor domain-containing protein n=1 Tax=Clostridium sp. TaxID=1506 RepID=UPI0025C5060A|nr:LPXTG cell wall anchor domain-containing protein [Clostridium sp.]MCF0149761.1 LPXTG cell wall anchor domain-containing protein [Clostridium sp.]